MFPRYIRWQLPLSYAAIALISALLLGAILLTTLQGYYVQREYEYLYSNAETITSTITQMMGENTPNAVIQAQIVSFSFLSQVRIRLLNADGEVIADSGVPHEHNLVSISARPDSESPPSPAAAVVDPMLDVDDLQRSLPPEDYFDLMTFRTSIQMPIGISVEGSPTGEGSTYTPVITLDFVRSQGGDAVMQTTAAGGSSPQTQFTYVLPATGTLYGFDLSSETVKDGERSPQSVTRPLYSAQGELIGTLELSEGPARGLQIVERVAYGLFFASVMAIIVAAAAGWAISRRITAPLQALTAITTRMAEGDLSARIRLNRDDELGLLAHTFNKMAQRVEDTVTTLRRFIADAAHELHTPLTALQTNLELVIDEIDWETRRSYANRAQTQIRRLESLTDGLLDLSRIEAGMMDDEHRPVELTALVQEVSELYASRSEQAGVHFVLELPPVLVTVRGHSGQLRCVIANLLDNAIKFTPAGETVSVRLRPAGDRVEIDVQDHGIGIPPEEASLIFSRFHRCRNAASYPGSGLGLAIVRSIVELHGGQITVENGAPGTTFRVLVPALPAAAMETQ